MQDQDNLKYATLGFAAVGLGIAFFWGAGIFPVLFMGVGALGLIYILHKEGIGGRAQGTRPAAMCAQLAFIVLAFGFPFTFLVQGAREEAQRAERQSRQASTELDGYERSLLEMKEEYQVQVSEAGLQRERRRNLALQEDVDSLRERLELRRQQEYVVTSDDVDLAALNERINDDLSQLGVLSRQEQERRGRITDISSVRSNRLGFQELLKIDSLKQKREEIDGALGDLEVITQVLGRAIQAGIREVTRVDPGARAYDRHDAGPQVDVASRSVLVEVNAEVEDIACFLYLLQSRRPYIGVISGSIPIPATRSRKPSDEPEKVIKGERVTARFELEAYYQNDGLWSGDEETPAATPTEGQRPGRFF